MDSNALYLAEEVAENHRDGHLTRREAMRQLAYLGFSAVGASALLAACGDDKKDETAGSQATSTVAPVVTTAPGPTGPTTTGPPVATQDITYPGKGHTVMGVFAPAKSPRGAVLVIHENRGITDFVRGITGRIAGSGYTALAVDLLSPQGGTAAHPDPAELQSVLLANAQEVGGSAVDDMKSSLEELQRRAPGQKLGVTGFCFGGNMVWSLLAAGDPPPLSAAVPFYGQTNNPLFGKTKAAVLAIYAELDTRVNANQPQAKLGLEQAKLTYDMKTFPGVNHAFMNNTGANYNQAQADAAYAAMADWFARYLK